MFRTLRLALSVTTGALLLSGAVEQVARAIPASTETCSATVIVDQAPVRSEPKDAAPVVEMISGGTALFVWRPPINQYLKVRPPDTPPPMPGPGRWIREDHVLIRTCF